MDQVKIGRFLAQLRHNAEMTQEMLGQKIGVTNKTISRWENGNYMPDIEMLKELSELFNVSINELLCGERINNDEFRIKADEVLISVIKNDMFSVREQTDFWKHKWLKEHLAMIIICCAVYIAAFVWSCISARAWLSGLCPLAGIITYALIRNKMMIYVEAKLYCPSNQDNQRDIEA